MSDIFEAGSLTFSGEDKTRKEEFGDGNGNRRVTVRLYFPVKKETVKDKEKAVYVSERKLAAIKKSFHLSNKEAAKIGRYFYENVPMDKENKYPLLLFSPGYNSYVEANSILCSDLASHGYIVASVGHPYEAVLNEYDDGSFDLSDKHIGKLMYEKGLFKTLRAQLKLMKKKGSLEEMDGLFNDFQNEYMTFIKSRMLVWVEDMKFALRLIKEKYSDYIDFSNGVAASGHSLGGATAYYLCHTCDEVVCGLNIDGGLFGDYQDKILKKPFYQFTCKENWNVESSVLLRREAPVYTAIFSNIKHIGFTDVKFFMNPGVFVGSMEAVKMHKYLFSGHLAFLDKYLKGLDVEIPLEREDGVIIEMHD